MSLGLNERLSVFPLNVNIISFTFAYLVCMAANNDAVMQSVPTIVFFSILWLSTVGWELTNSCVTILNVFLSFFFGAGFGVAFAYWVLSGDFTQLQFFNGITNGDVCKHTQNQVFECEVDS